MAMKQFKSIYGRYGTYIGKTKLENRIQFQYNEYQTDDKKIIEGLMNHERYGIDFSLIEEFPVRFTKYVSKSKMDKGNPEIIGNIASENEALKKKIAELEAGNDTTLPAKSKPVVKK